MALTITSPASLVDLAEMSGAVSRPMWAVARHMWASGRTWTLRDGEQLVGLVGLYPVGLDAEAWFNVRPEASRHMLAIVRAARLTLAASEYREIVAICTSDAGRRIARAIGMRLFDRTKHGEVWSCNSSVAGVPQNSSSKPSSARASPT